jgi:hypothetical protein
VNECSMLWPCTHTHGRGRTCSPHKAKSIRSASMASDAALSVERKSSALTSDGKRARKGAVKPAQEGRRAFVFLLVAVLTVHSHAQLHTTRSQAGPARRQQLNKSDTAPLASASSSALRPGHPLSRATYHVDSGTDREGVWVPRR